LSPLSYLNKDKEEEMDHDQREDEGSEKVHPLDLDREVTRATRDKKSNSEPEEEETLFLKQDLSNLPKKGASLPNKIVFEGRNIVGLGRVGLAVEYERISGDIPGFVATGTIEFSTKKLEEIKGDDSRSSEASSYPSRNFQRGYPRPRYSYRGMNKRGRGAGCNTYKRPRSQSPPTCYTISLEANLEEQKKIMQILTHDLEVERAKVTKMELEIHNLHTA